MTSFWLGVGAAVGLLVGMVLHEYAHAQTAVAMGDRTPKLYGRVTLNPKAHIDPLGTIILPAIFVIPIMVGKPLGLIFGYAKPVPLNPRSMRDRRWSPLLVALAGPGTNLLLAALAGVGLSALGEGAVFRANPASLVLSGAITVNVFLCIINSLPIPPLDGSRVLGLFLSPEAASKLEDMSQYLLLFLLMLFLVFGGVIGRMADPVCRAVSLDALPACLL